MEIETFPKTIWFLWFQGLNSAPLVVQKCYRSWVKHNPEWTIIVLDEHNINQYVPLSPNDLTKQALSDIIRINLLAKRGGVWVDATCYCTKPLNSWIFDYTTQGFFAFNKPGPDRMISSWFMASTPDNYISATYLKEVNNYWEDNPNLKFSEHLKWRFLRKKLKSTEPQAWFSFFIKKVVKVYPYFWFHYLFERIYLNDERVKEVWDLTPKISADIPHHLQIAGLFKPLSPQLKEHIDQTTSPCYKLTWKFNDSEFQEESVLGYVLNLN